MGVLPDTWIRKMAKEHGMISPFADAQQREGGLRSRFQDALQQGASFLGAAYSPVRNQSSWGRGRTRRVLDLAFLRTTDWR